MHCYLCSCVMAAMRWSIFTDPKTMKVFLKVYRIMARRRASESFTC
ncbi:unnamed protein product [Amoebophrya sp. A120]|nr:unnamed protein product [Amoebophrya sp. A120]|eukprot:GSA120T00003204001.1